jgi:hypothetical protein
MRDDARTLWTLVGRRFSLRPQPKFDVRAADPARDTATIAVTSTGEVRRGNPVRRWCRARRRAPVAGLANRAAKPGLLRYVADDADALVP